MPDVTVEKRFAIVPEWIVFHPDLSGNAVRVYAVLARRGDGKGECFPSYARIGKDCGFSPKTAKRCIQELVDASAVVKKRRRGDDGAPTSNLYVVMVSDPADRKGGGDNADPTRVTHDPPGDTDDPRGGVTDDRRVGSPVSPERKPLNESHSEELPDQGPADTDAGPTHQQVVDRLVAVCGLTLPLTKAEGGRLGKAARGIRPVIDHLDVIDAKAAGYRRKWPDIDLTPTALESNWSQVDADRTPVADPHDGAVTLARNFAGLPWDDVESMLISAGFDVPAFDAAREAWDLEQDGAAA